MKYLFKISWLVMMIYIISSCSGKKENTNRLSEFSLEGEWNILKVDGESLSMKSTPFVGFDLKLHQIYGYGGCNRFFGKLDIDSVEYGRISVGNLASTKAMCHNAKMENLILDALKNVAYYNTVSDSPEQISLYTADSLKVLLLGKKKVEESSLSELSGEWVIETTFGKKIIGTAEIVPFIGFDADEGRIYGNVGCNTINGELSQDSAKANSLIFNNIASTMLLCPSMETEKIIMECLNATASFKKENDGRVILYNNKGDELLVLKKE